MKYAKFTDPHKDWFAEHDGAKVVLSWQTGGCWRCEIPESGQVLIERFPGILPDAQAKAAQMLGVEPLEWTQQGYARNVSIK